MHVYFMHLSLFTPEDSLIILSYFMAKRGSNKKFGNYVTYDVEHNVPTSVLLLTCIHLGGVKYFFFLRWVPF